MPTVLIKRGTRAQIDAAALAAGLLANELYYITDDDVLAIGTGTGSYSELPNQGTGGAAYPASFKKPGTPAAEQFPLNWFGKGDYATANAIAAGRVYLWAAFYEAGTYASARLITTTSNAAATNCFVGVYDAAATVLSGVGQFVQAAKLAETNAFALTTTGLKTVSFSAPFVHPGGWVFMAISSNGASGTVNVAAMVDKEAAVPPSLKSVTSQRAGFSIQNFPTADGSLPAVTPLAGWNSALANNYPIISLLT